MNHLTPESLQALLAGELAESDRKVVREHLDQGCLVCAAVLEEEENPGVVDLGTLARLLEAEDAPASSMSRRERETSWLAMVPHLPGRSVSARIIASTPDLRAERGSDQEDDPDDTLRTVVPDDLDLPPDTLQTVVPDDLDAPRPPLRLVPRQEPAGEDETLTTAMPDDDPYDGMRTVIPDEPPPPDSGLSLPPPESAATARPWWRSPAVMGIGAVAAAAVATVVILPRLQRPTAADVEPTPSEPSGVKGLTPETPEEKGITDEPQGDVAPPEAAPADDLEVHLTVNGGVMKEDHFEHHGAIEPGTPVARGTSLLFVIDANANGARYLFASDASGDFVRLYPPEGANAGTSREGNRPVTWSSSYITLETADLDSPIEIVAALSQRPVPLDPDIRQAYDSYRSGGEAGEFPIVFDTTTIEIEP